MVKLRQNEIETVDDIFPLTGSTAWPGFVDIEPLKVDTLPPTNLSALNWSYKTYGLFRIMLSEETVKHTRSIYSLLDLFGDFGGVRVL